MGCTPGIYKNNILKYIKTTFLKFRNRRYLAISFKIETQEI